MHWNKVEFTKMILFCQSNSGFTLETVAFGLLRGEGWVDVDMEAVASWDQPQGFGYFH